MVTKSSPLRKKFGARILELRKSIGLSQEKLGFETGLDRTYISGIERGLRNPSLENIGRLAKALKIPLSRLFSFD
ncbi:helix-turn-helix transcriptional regulator [Candidatus Daviesbacteria bacterium]|nr:helix-turn-helix transcriptional regulator [Candidatus Daviesbacteria bacterium]